MSSGPLVTTVMALISRERAAREAAEREARDAHFLSDASGLLAESLDHDTVLGRLARLLVRGFCDWCLIDVVEGEVIRRVAGTHAQPALEPLVAELARRYPPRWDTPQPTGRVIRTGESLLVSQAEPADLARHLVDDEQIRMTAALGNASGLCVPLRGGGRVLGSMSMGVGHGGRRFDERDLALAEELGRRAGGAIENARAYRRAQEERRERDELLLVAAHELNTPMASLMLNLEALLGGPDAIEPSEATRTRMIELAHRQGRRLVRLVHDLLDVGRAARTPLTLAAEELELGGLVKDVCARLHGELERAGCSLELDVASGIVGQWDAGRLEQVVFNLLTNAVKFGAGHTIGIKLERVGDVARLSVRDHGIGVDERLRARIFERFVRGAAASRYGGLGLGLYITRCIVEAHGGRIGAESTPGQGSLFTVELPCRGAELFASA